MNNLMFHGKTDNCYVFRKWQKKTNEILSPLTADF